ncbi:BspA family leucine-rich repeat surface protein [archaeon]|nr:MAG: BspA family leucine-rich repeat surface protein [archaeon]
MQSAKAIQLCDANRMTDVCGMFYQASSFNQPIVQWDVCMVASMLGMFGEAAGGGMLEDMYTLYVVVGCIVEPEESVRAPVSRYTAVCIIE